MSLRNFKFGLAVVLGAALTPALSCSRHNSELINHGNPDLGSGDAASCFSAGEACAMGGECCSGACDATTHICVRGMCQPDNGSCQKPTDCCNLNCSGNVCGASQCISNGEDCTAPGSVCCSTRCESGKCASLGTQCKTAGNACNSPDECCNHTCVDNHCAAPSQVSYCTQVNDICFQDNDCCTGVCTIPAGWSAGTCTAITTFCNVDGTVCNGCTGDGLKCCSSYCAPFGNSGSKICQPASGCHVLGDLCRVIGGVGVDSDCCGGDVQSGLPGAGLVKCTPVPGHPEIGTCSDANPTNCPNNEMTCKNACQPEGDVCHFKDHGGCSSNMFPADCCGMPGSSSGVCKLDRVGIPRCYGLGTSCVMEGNACASSQDCCNELPCVPDGTGHLKCSAMSCVPEGGVCTTTGDCCAGLPCQVPPGQLQGKCINQTPPPDGGTADLAGVDQAAVCALDGQDCSTPRCCQNPNASCYKDNSTNLCQAGDTCHCIVTVIL